MTTSNKGTEATTTQSPNDESAEATGGQADRRVLIVIAVMLILPALLKFFA